MHDLELAGRLLHKLAASKAPGENPDPDTPSEPIHGSLGVDVVRMFDALTAADFDLFAAIVMWAHDA
ncbi:hypothetical protein MSIMFB_03890 [Mycobacterium simulans]|uniref:Uncharacterized protein n=1 Tax=Mycobacterium simulans TaxID=627089 RepID=A0A7Z7NBV6_9MYCO|nr:hypothetical protein [Mycobacterium simulans]SOJ56413.1 hypothetical protein MSIMFB_03890 [Mycobacterium simulans]